MREIRKSGSEGGVGFNPPFLPLSADYQVLWHSAVASVAELTCI